jgi:sugar lactone lactonase YvrE
MFSVDPTTLAYAGEGLSRPECVMATRSGDLFMPDKRGGIAVIRADGRTELILAKNAPGGFMPNGFAVLPDRSFLIADLGPEGGVWHMSSDGTLTPKLLEIEGRHLEPTNFVGIDAKGRVWVSVSTKLIPRELSMQKGVADGYILMIDDKGARIVADGLGFTNEAIVDPTGRWLYVNETIARRTSRFEIAADGSLGPRETFTEYGPASFPDGFAFDVEGGIWTVTVVSNRVIRVKPNGTQEIVFEDCDQEAVAAAEAAFQNGTYSRAHLDAGGKRPAGNLSGIAFAGPDLRTVYLGSLFAPRLARFQSPVAGAPPVHWTF